jgi:autotransporter translocation and assembly factor TamB
MGQDFWLRSTDANVLLTGNLSVNKLRSQYRIDGTLQAPRGTYRLPLALGISRDFAVTGGQIRYLGTPDLNADLDIDAEHIVRGTTGGKDVEVYVNVGGTMYDPRVTLTSDHQPTLSEPEIINYLLFGAPNLRQGTTTSGFESRLLAQWLSTTVSAQFEYALISDLGVPLDYLQIRPTTGSSGVTGAEVAVGKQFRVLGTTAFLTASPRYCRNQATSLASVGASLEFRLSRSWLVAASVDPLVGCESAAAQTSGAYQFGADLFWEKSY